MTSRTESPQNAQLLFVGQQCHKEQCYIVDFLPFKCDHCQHQFCADHYKPDDHACEQYDALKHDRIAPPCPFCNTPIAIPLGQDPNLRMERHIETECKVTTGRTKAGTMPVCARGRCGKKLYAPIKCNSCNKQFCPEHRYPSSHSCNTASNSSSSSPKGAGPTIGARTSAAGSAAMAAIKRSMPNSITSSPASASNPSPQSPVRANNASKSDASSNSPRHNPFSRADRRAKAEQESRLKGMRERAKKGLLSDAEKVQLAQMEAAIASGKKDSDCAVM